MKNYSILKNIRILYVEDNESILEQFLKILELHTDTIYVSRNAEEGLASYLKYQPDLVITDTHIPGQSRLELATAIKKLNPEQAVLIATTFSDPDFLIQAVAVGIDGYILKPLDDNKLLDSLCDVTEKLLFNKKLKQQTEYLQIMMNSNPNMMIIMSDIGVEYINQTLQKFVGYKPSKTDNFDNFCLFNYFQSLDGQSNLIQTRQELIHYFIDNPDKQHIVRFKQLDAAQSSQATQASKHAFIMSMTHQKNLNYFVFSLADITKLANENRRLENSASTDSLTGISNRTMFEQEIKRYIDCNNLHNEPFILIFFDIDHFKIVNDNYGHDVGDQVLRDLTQLITKNIREQDFFARWGGEEFILLLKGETIEKGLETSEHLRNLIENTKFNSIESITCSFAVVDFQPTDTAESLLKRADIALYRAKAAGRNCVNTYEIDYQLKFAPLKDSNIELQNQQRNKEPLILIADDDYMQRLPMRSALESFNFRVEEAENGSQALEMFQQLKPDMVILDVIMPDIDGFQVCRNIRKQLREQYLPILMLTGLDDVDSINQAYTDGATDFLSKPINWTLLGHKIRYLLRAANVSQMLARREVELLDIQGDIINRLAKAAEYKDANTGHHITRMSQYSFELGKAIGLNEELCDILLKASPMHDVGKIGISDSQLLKPGKLTPEEFEEIKKHPSIGAELLSKNHSHLMEAAHIIALTHHEKWDGSGYPNKLAGEQIPIFGRICAIADVFDALTSSRPYKKAWPTQAAFNMIKEGAGSHFDPQLVAKFIEISARIIEIKMQYQDIN